MTEPEPARRRFLTRIVVGLNAAVAVLIAIPAIGYLVSPLIKRGASWWVSIGRVTDLMARRPRAIQYRYRDQSGYAVERVRRTAYVTREGDDVIVLSPVCTHMGCNVAFNEATGLFECPCHGGLYDVRGAVVDGPPPQPLRRFRTRVRDGNLEIHVT